MKTSLKQTSLFTKEILTSSLVVSPAKTLQTLYKQAMGRSVLKVSERDYSLKCAELFKKSDQNSLLPKMWLTFSEQTKEKTLVESCMNYPEWGTMQNGELVMRQKSVPPIIGAGCIWLLTPTASEYKETKVFFSILQETIKQECGKITGTDVEINTGGDWLCESPIYHVVNGFPSDLGILAESIKAGGNAIVPQVALQIFKAINQFNNQNYGH